MASSCTLAAMAAAVVGQKIKGRSGMRERRGLADERKSDEGRSVVGVGNGAWIESFYGNVESRRKSVGGTQPTDFCENSPPMTSSSANESSSLRIRIHANSSHGRDKGTLIRNIPTKWSPDSAAASIYWRQTRNHPSLKQRPHGRQNCKGLLFGLCSRKGTDFRRYRGNV